MSLGSFLKTKDVRERFCQEFPCPKLKVEKALLAPPLTRRYPLVGTAFDYLLRFYLRRLNPKAVTRQWIAETALCLLKLSPDTEIIGYKMVNGKYVREVRAGSENERYKKACKDVTSAKKLYLSFLENGIITNKLLGSAILLAQLDPIFRSNFIDPNLGSVDNKDIKDLKKLMSFVDPNIFKSKKVCILNPTFGKASLLVGGADADLVIDDVIVDIKTTKNFCMLKEYFHQLIGYYVLSRIGHIEGAPPKHQINKLAIYFSRHAYLAVMDVKDIINERTFPRFLRWFKERANQELKTREERLADNLARKSQSVTFQKVRKSGTTVRNLVR